MKGTTQKWLAMFAAVAITFGMTACSASSNDGGEEHDRSEGRGEEGEGEHARNERGGEHGDEGGEESGEYIAKDATWDKVRRGGRLVLSYDASAGAFVGRVVNTTERTLCAIRVEVHLGGGPELGPTEPTDVPAGGSTDVRLSAEGESFETWTAHPEMSACS